MKMEKLIKQWEHRIGLWKACELNEIGKSNVEVMNTFLAELKNEVHEQDSWMAARTRMYLTYRKGFKMSMIRSFWRSIWTWFLWDIYDVIRYRLKHRAR